MQAFSGELLSILVLVAISWAGITCIAVIIFFIVYIWLSYSEHRLRSKTINPIRSPSTSNSLNNRSPSISPIPTKTPIITTDQHKISAHRYDTISVTDDHSYSSSYENKNKFQQQEYLHDENDETTATINGSEIYGQRHQQRQYQSMKPPMKDVRLNDRHTPYPPDVLAREKFMNNIRFPPENKY